MYKKNEILDYHRFEAWDCSISWFSPALHTKITSAQCAHAVPKKSRLISAPNQVFDVNTVSSL